MMWREMKGNTGLLDPLLLYSNTILVTALKEKNQKSPSKIITHTKILYKKKESRIKSRRIQRYRPLHGPQPCVTKELAFNEAMSHAGQGQPTQMVHSEEF